MTREPTGRSGDIAPEPRAGFGDVELIKRLYELSDDLMCSVAVETRRFIDVNPAWERTLGWTADELIGRETRDFVHPDDIARVSEETTALAAAGSQIVGHENRYRTRDGAWRWLQWTAASDGSIWYATARDVTERRVAEAALKSSERVLAEAQRVAKLGSWEVDLGAGTARWSAEMYRVFGIEQEAFGRRFSDFLELLEPEDRRVVELKVEHSVSTGWPYSSRFRR